MYVHGFTEYAADSETKYGDVSSSPDTLSGATHQLTLYRSIMWRNWRRPLSHSSQSCRLASQCSGINNLTIPERYILNHFCHEIFFLFFFLLPATPVKLNITICSVTESTSHCILSANNKNFFKEIAYIMSVCIVFLGYCTIL